jgi:DUF4097 and DUF4098 domain-containing protein YvlB
MSDQEMPVKEQEQPSSEEQHLDGEVRKQEAYPPKATAPQPYERARSPMPPPFIPFTQPPHTWPAYTPGAGPQWASGGQFGPPAPRGRSRWPWIVLALLLVFLLLTGGAFFIVSILGYNFAGNTNSVTETQHFSVSANPTLVLNNDTGSMHVRAGSGNEVSIQATKHSGPGGNLNDVKVNYTQDREGNTVTVNVDRLTNASFSWSTSVDFEITVPSAAILQLKTNSGDIDVSGVSGQMVLSSNTGSIQASDGTVSGKSELITNTGSITFNGSVDRSGTYRFETNTGSVNVTLPSESVFHLDASTDTGSINTNFAAVLVQHRQFVGADAHSDVGSAPQATISLKTNTGSINLFQR